MEGYEEDDEFALDGEDLQHAGKVNSLSNLKNSFFKMASKRNSLIEDLTRPYRNVGNKISDWIQGNKHSKLIDVIEDNKEESSSDDQCNSEYLKYIATKDDVPKDIIYFESGIHATSWRSQASDFIDPGEKNKYSNLSFSMFKPSTSFVEKVVIENNTYNEDYSSGSDVDE